MIADKSMPMFDPDNQWVDRKFLRVLLDVYRLSPETIYKLMDPKEILEKRVVVKTISTFRFTLYNVNRDVFVDVCDPHFGSHHVHAYWRSFTDAVSWTASERTSHADRAKTPIVPAKKDEDEDEDSRIDTLAQSVDVLEKRLHELEVRFASCPH